MKLSLYQFKNHAESNLELSEALQVIVGDNGAGKSTLCEAISILMNASNSHHTKWEEKSSFLKELPRNEAEDLLKNKSPLFSSEFPSPFKKGVNGTWALRLLTDEHLFEGIFDGKNISPRWHIDGETRTKPKYEDKMPYRAFWIQSDHLRVISGEPSERRNFLDDMLVFASPQYSRVMSKYKTALTTRNRVIQSILDSEATKSDLSSWNTLFADYAVQVIRERRKFFEWFEKQSLDGLDLPGPARIELVERHPLEIVDQEHLLELVRNYTERDLVVGRTTIGPHLDEISFSALIDGNWVPTKYILSRGENKILLLAFIRLLGKYVEEVSMKKPFFLLDDVLSELDTAHIEILCGLYKDTNAIMTTQPNHTSGLTGDVSRIVL